MRIKPFKKLFIFCCYAAIITGLYLIRLHSFLLFHSIVEIFSVCVAFAIFMIVWNSSDFIQNKYFVFIGIAHLFIGLLHIQGWEFFRDMGLICQPSYGYLLDMWRAYPFL